MHDDVRDGSQHKLRPKSEPRLCGHDALMNRGANPRRSARSRCKPETQPTHALTPVSGLVPVLCRPPARIHSHRCPHAADIYFIFSLARTQLDQRLNSDTIGSGAPGRCLWWLIGQPQWKRCYTRITPGRRAAELARSGPGGAGRMENCCTHGILCLGCTRHRQDYVADIARRFDPDRPAVAGLPWLMNEYSDAVNDDSSIRPSLSLGPCN